MDILDDEDPTSPIENGEMTFDSIYSFLLDKGDIIITIDKAAEEAVRRGLSLVKHQHTKKMRQSNPNFGDKTIKYKVVEEIEGTEPAQIRLQIWLEKKSGVYIHRIVVPDNGL